MIIEDVQEVLESLKEIGFFDTVNDKYNDLVIILDDIRVSLENLGINSSSDISVLSDNFEQANTTYENVLLTYENIENILVAQTEFFYIAFGFFVGLFIGIFIVRVIFDGN